MFDIGFPELFIVALVMLVVLGPERLPETLRTAGLWLGRLRRSFASVKAEIEKEVGMDDIKRQLHNEAIMDEMKRLESEVRGEPDAAARNAQTDHSEDDPDPPGQHESRQDDDDDYNYDDDAHRHSDPGSTVETGHQDSASEAEAGDQDSARDTEYPDSGAPRQVAKQP
jgi:sec-independent protein translocase protein TatB